MSAAKKVVLDPMMQIAAIVMEVTGVQLTEKQRPMIEARLTRRMRELHIADVHEYWQYFESNKNDELPEVITILTTHHTFFFREYAQFEFLLSKLPGLISSAKSRSDKTIRIWSAGCSRGQEVYSLALFLTYHLEQMAPDVNIDILGTDIDRQSIAIARNSVYTRKEVNEIPLVYLGKNWIKGTGEIADYVKARPSLKEKCRFEVVNLLEFPAFINSSKFDLILCRNVFIYFSPTQIKSVSSNFARLLDNNGFLFLGVSETLNGLGLPLELVGPSVYSKKQAATEISKTQTVSAVSAAAAKAKKSDLPFKPTSVTTIPPSLSKPREILRVMCVDDSASILALMSKILVPEEGFQIVATANNGLEAAKKLRETKIDIVTLDIHMPEQTGIEYLQKNLGATHPPVVMVTAVSRDDSDLAIKALQAGATDYVEKPALNNFNERADEIRTKLRAAYNSKKNKKSLLLDLDRSFQRHEEIKNPENKCRVVIASLSDKDGLGRLISELQGKQPPTYLLIEGAESALPAFAKQLSRETNKTIEYLPIATGSELVSSIVLSDFKASIRTLLTKNIRKKTSIIVFGDVSKHAVQKILEWSNAQLLLEDIGNKKGTAALNEVATDVVPVTSFAYLSSHYLAGES